MKEKIRKLMTSPFRVYPMLTQTAHEKLIHADSLGESIEDSDYAVVQKEYVPTYMNMYAEYKPSHLNPERRRPYYLCITLDGEGILTYEGVEYSCATGTVFLIDLNCRHELRTKEGSEYWHILWVSFHGKNAGHYYGEYRKQQGKPVQKLPVNSDIISKIRILMRLYKEPSAILANDLYAETIIMGMIVSLMSFDDDHISEKKMPDIVKKAQDFIHKNHASHVTLDTISQQIAVDKFHLHKQFKKHTGITPNDYILMIRIRHAKELLCNSNRSISHICNEVGFSSTSHFIRQFKLLEGITPARYRLLHGQKQ